MQESKIQYVLEQLKTELHRFIDTLGEIPYVALPLEKPEIICFSGKIKELTGYDANEILVDREHWANMIYPDDCGRVFAAFAECKNKGMSFNMGYRIVHKDDSVRYVNDKGEPVFDDRGEITQIEGAITPLREVTKTEKIPLLEFGKATTSNNVNPQHQRIGVGINSNCFQKV
ncbi:PAS domain-containing protein [bacterium]|nr:PAS domain-containing protein [Planctomycetota bacterium]MBU1517983.1 PAS domain-containing protein [Planctomycetota bacterium]MBU2461753.1 PAS domain-containing protein [bacterium]